VGSRALVGSATSTALPCAGAPEAATGTGVRSAWSATLGAALRIAPKFHARPVNRRTPGASRRRRPRSLCVHTSSRLSLLGPFRIEELSEVPVNAAVSGPDHPRQPAATTANSPCVTDHASRTTHHASPSKRPMTAYAAAGVAHPPPATRCQSTLPRAPRLDAPPRVLGKGRRLWRRSSRPTRPAGGREAGVEAPGQQRGWVGTSSRVAFAMDRQRHHRPGLVKPTASMTCRPRRRALFFLDYSAREDSIRRLPRHHPGFRQGLRREPLRPSSAARRPRCPFSMRPANTTSAGTHRARRRARSGP